MRSRSFSAIAIIVAICFLFWLRNIFFFRFSIFFFKICDVFTLEPFFGHVFALVETFLFSHLKQNVVNLHKFLLFFYGTVILYISSELKFRC